MRRSQSVLVFVGACALLLSGCALLPAAVDPGTTATPSQSSEPATSPTPTATVGPDDIALSIPCAEVVSDEVIYEWGSGNWAADPSFGAAAGSSAAAIVESGGTACGWINLTSGEKLSVAIGQFESGRLAEIREERAASSDAVSDFGVDGFFSASGQNGQADAFSGPYWVSASSSWFGASSDAAPIVQAALNAPS